jgi:TonB family protein
MSRLAIVTIFLAACSLMTPAVISGGAPQKRAAYGPVVSAYLTGLAEELNELEYQLRNREIGPLDYERAKQRLTILRRQVERLAAQRGADLVPELQILADDELGELGLGRKLEPGELRVGDRLSGQWKLIGIELGRARYFVFDRITPSDETPFERVISARRPRRIYDPQQVIETIVVRDRPLPVPDSSSKIELVSNRQPDAEAAASPDAASTRVAEPGARFRPPLILQVRLPGYTDKARSNGVEGDLLVRALVQADGKIKHVRIERGLGSGLDQLAIDSVKKMEFEPAQFDDRAVGASVQIVFNFKPGRIAFYLKMAEPDQTTAP